MNDSKLHYEIIADIHGRFDKLELLMGRLGYRHDGISFVPPAGHRALFLGDLIDPKPGHACPGGVRATLESVKAMCDRGDALCLMGNHEANAIYFHSKGPDGQWLREHSEKNHRMHHGTHADFPDYGDPAGEWPDVWIPWMKRLPLFLDLGNVRAVHATWHAAAIAAVAGRTLEDETLFFAGSDKTTPEGKALEILLKGLEVDLPAGTSYVDHTGASRRQIRARWWELPAAGLGYDGLIFPVKPDIPSDPVTADVFAAIPGYPLEAPPVFFGHYFKPVSSPLQPERGNVACLDHSAAKDGPLVAYRWNGEAILNPENYICQI